jgi:hypothetical protein
LRVLLVHGMGRSPASMLLLAARLQRAGVRTQLFGYLPAAQSFESIAERLSGRLRRLAGEGEYLVVGHSLGGLLLRAALGQLEADIRRPNHLFMLATPNQSPRLARRFQRNPLYRLYTGDAGQLLANPERVGAIPFPAVPYTLVAGVSGRRGKGSPFADEPNDWIVSLGEVRLSESDEVVTLSVGHTFLMNYREVADLILERAGVVGSKRPEPRDGSRS